MTFGIIGFLLIISIRLMNLIFFNIQWMSWNLFLACLGVFFGWLTFRSKKHPHKLIFFLFYLLFAPNTLYILTDLIHFPEQFSQVVGSIKLLLFSQYLFFVTIGIITYYFSLYFIEKTLSKIFRKSTYMIYPFITILNFAIAFGVIMGRFMRTNSWYIFTDQERVINDAFGILFSPSYMSYVLAFWILSNIMYFSTRKSTATRKALAFAEAKN